MFAAHAASHAAQASAAAEALRASYSPPLVLASFLIAALASYTALDFAGRVAAARGAARGAWLAAGALALEPGNQRNGADFVRFVRDQADLADPFAGFQRGDDMLDHRLARDRDDAFLADIGGGGDQL